MLKRYEHRTPAGLVLPRAHAGFRGRVRWQVLDERGVPEVPRNPSGFAIGPVEGVEQSNLILDRGLDDFAVTPPFGDFFRRCLHVGTSSVAPAVTDVALGTEVQRLFGGSTTPTGSFELDTVNNVFRGSWLLARQVTMTADRNLTEFGLGRLDDANVNIRELFRDELDNPVTISILSGKTIIVNHTIIGEIAAPAAGTPFPFNIERYDATNTLVSTTAYTSTFGPMGNDAGKTAFLAWDPSKFADAVVITGANTYGRANNLSAATTTADFELDGAYVSGSYERAKAWTLGAGTAYTLYGFGMGSSLRGFVVLFDSPATYSRLSTDSLSATWTSTWARA